MKLTNGTGAEYEQDVGLSPAEQACVELLETALADAKAGRVSSCAVIACGPGDFGASFAGPDAARLNLGLDHCKATIMAKIMQPAPQQRGSILRPGMR